MEQESKLKAEVVGDLQKIKDDLAKEAFRETVKEDRKKGLCIQCRDRH